MKKENTYNIFLDDSRNITEAFYKFNNPIYNSCITIKNYKDFTEYIENRFNKDGSYPAFISFDFHLTNSLLDIRFNGVHDFLVMLSTFFMPSQPTGII